MDTASLQRIVAQRTLHWPFYTGRCTPNTWDVHGDDCHTSHRRFYLLRKSQGGFTSCVFLCMRVRGVIIRCYDPVSNFRSYGYRLVTAYSVTAYNSLETFRGEHTLLVKCARRGRKKFQFEKKKNIFRRSRVSHNTTGSASTHLWFPSFYYFDKLDVSATIHISMPVRVWDVRDKPHFNDVKIFFNVWISTNSITNSLTIFTVFMRRNTHEMWKSPQWENHPHNVLIPKHVINVSDLPVRARAKFLRKSGHSTWSHNTL